MASTACFLHHRAPSTATSKIPSQRFAPGTKSSQLVCMAQKQADVEDESNAVLSRRLALTAKVAPADAAYGRAANISGKPKTNTDFLPYNGHGFKLMITSKWNPNKEVEYPGQVLRYENNFDSNSNVTVIIAPTDEIHHRLWHPRGISLTGKQAYFGKTASEGGFDIDAVSTANILEASTPVVDGKQYYYTSVLTRTADGDEGGKHQLITATVKDGKLYICKAQAGDKRWFKGARKFDSFNVA